jgi:transcriptional regulator with XRE-family HTH domain
MKLSEWLAAEKRTDKSLAAEMGVTRQTISRWRRGTDIPQKTKMAEIVRITGGKVQPQDFYDFAA